MGKMAVKEKEENLKSKTSTTMSSHGPTLSSEGCRVVRGGRRVELLQRLLPQVFSGDPLFYFSPNNTQPGQKIDVWYAHFFANYLCAKLFKPVVSLTE